jgi:hypothetical protein
MSRRPSRVAHDLIIQRAIRALPALPATFTAKQLQRQMPDRSANQCRRLMDILVARGYCTRSSKALVGALPSVDAPRTVSDVVLELCTTTQKPVTVVDAMTVLPGVSRQSAHRTLERMVDLGLLTRAKVATPAPPHWRNEYQPAVAAPRVRLAVPEGCLDPHCACPIAESDYDSRHGRLVRVICRRHETARMEVLACSR